MQQWADIRRRVLIEGTSKRQILRETGLHWKTLKKILENSAPPGYRQERPRAKRKLGPYVWRIEQILKEDKAMPKKQRHTAKRIFERHLLDIVAEYQSQGQSARAELEELKEALLRLVRKK